MRLVPAPYNFVKECRICCVRDEDSVTAYILCFQVANYFLTHYKGEWEIDESGIWVQLKGLNKPLYFDLNAGTLFYDTFVYQLHSRYTPKAGVRGLVNGICRDFHLILESSEQPHCDPLFNLLVKLVEIFHARCGLTIKNTTSVIEGWEISLGLPGTEGWIGRDGTVQNRFGDKTRLELWFNLRPEKMATYLFGFNRYCSHYPNPIK